MSDRPKKKEPYKCSTKGCATMIAGDQSYEVCHACVASTNSPPPPINKVTVMSETLYLTVEAFAGSQIKDAIAGLEDLNKRLGITCFCKFNGVQLMFRNGDSAENMLENWREEMQSKASHRIATGGKR